MTEKQAEKLLNKILKDNPELETYIKKITYIETPDMVNKETIKKLLK